jgi:2-haloacid dehalogenase
MATVHFESADRISCAVHDIERLAGRVQPRVDRPEARRIVEHGASLKGQGAAPLCALDTYSWLGLVGRNSLPNDPTPCAGKRVAGVICPPLPTLKLSTNDGLFSPQNTPSPYRFNLSSRCRVLREGYNLTVMRHSKMTLHQRWATFDCYGTLIDWDRGLAGTMLRLWPDADREWLLARYHAVEPLIQEGRSLPYREVMARALRAIAAIEGLALFPEQEHSLSDSLSTWPAFPEVSASLQTLRDRGWKLAILSNTDPDLLAASLEQIGVVVDLAITAHEAGSYKPARGHWDAFYRMSGADPGRHVHVGASIFHDIAPANRLGLPSVWINRLNGDSDVPRTAELPDLSRLPQTLEGILPLLV